MYSCDRLLLNVTLLNTHGQQLSEQAVVINAGTIVWCGAQEQLPSPFLMQPKDKIDGQGCLLTSGLIDCHTHLVHAGHRATEFKLRLEGVSYADIAKAGGGILSTVRQTRAASEETLFEQSLPRMLALKNEGVTTVEIKSGYGLDLATEIKMLTVARQLGKHCGVQVKTTFLGAHAIPPEFEGRCQAYVDYVCKEMLPAIKELHLADAVDVFCESIAFSLAQTEQIFQAAQSLDLPIKCHAEQLSNLGASALATRFHALSCDHLEFLEASDIESMAKAGTVAVLLPGAFYFLREQKKPPVELLRQYGIPIAIATDSNPGSSPTTSLLLMMNMACQLFGLTVPEAWLAVTINAARALGIANQYGSIEVGKVADLLLWSVEDSALPCYYFATPLPHQMMIAGEWV